MKIEKMSPVLKATLGAGLVATALILAFTDLVDAEGAARLMMIIFGAMLVFSGNAIPKSLRPLSSMRCPSTTEQTVRRLTGWFFVLTGLAWIGTWLLLPAEIAGIVTVLTAGACLLLTVGHVTWCLASRRRAPRAES